MKDNSGAYWKWVAANNGIEDAEGNPDQISDEQSLWPPTARMSQEDKCMIAALGEVLPLLSKTERKALTLISYGNSYDQTAELLGVSKARVQGLIGRIRTKVGIRFPALGE